MPAQRSRTQNWRTCLEQLHERSGSLEIAVRHDPAADPTGSRRHLVWRVRLLSVSDEDMTVEQPTAVGQPIDFETGIELVAVMTIGQNRWMFTTTNLGPAHRSPSGTTPGSNPGLSAEGQGPERRGPRGLRLALPETIERCQRRNSYRVETAALSVPQVEIWPLLEPATVLLAERANEIQFEMDPRTDHSRGEQAPTIPVNSLPSEEMLPQVGPRFAARLVNIGGGGLGLRVGPSDAQPLGRHKLFWLRFSLGPELPGPICVTAKLVHTHLESSQETYAGMAFDFSFNPGHQRFVIDQICRFIAIQQRAQMEFNESQTRRRSA